MEPSLSNLPSDMSHVLALAGWPERRMQLVCKDYGLGPAVEALRGFSADPAVLAGLWLYCGRFEESHSISQDIHTPDGSYWHGMLHRQEPDDFNAGYWFKRVGRHPIFPELSQGAETAGYAPGSEWDPLKFIDFTSDARRSGGENQRIAVEVQHIEFKLLLSWSFKHARMK